MGMRQMLATLTSVMLDYTVHRYVSYIFDLLPSEPIASYRYGGM
jgi:hypothetical protein